MAPYDIFVRRYGDDSPICCVTLGFYPATKAV